jgi:AraC-like DNA-binding protein
MPLRRDQTSNLTFAEPSRVARRLLWHMYSIGSRRIEQPDHHEPYEKPGAHLFWVQSGSGWVEYMDQRRPLERGRKVWLLDMSRPRTYIPQPGGHLTITGVRFGGPGLEFWHETLNSSAEPEFELDDVQRVRSVYQNLWRLARRRPLGWEWQAHMQINELLGQLLMSRGLLVSPETELPAPVVRVLNALAANPLKDWKARELAAVARVSYSGLRALFRKCGQGTIHQNIQRVRLDQARLLLADPRLSIKDVAAQLNFSSEFYFSHFFRKYTGLTPTEFRRRLQLNPAPQRAAGTSPEVATPERGAAEGVPKS